MPAKNRPSDAAASPAPKHERKPAPDLDALLKYREKRDLGQTPEPGGGEAPASGELTFVVQQHRATRMHWDFRLEVDGVLASWAVPRGPSLNTADKRMAAHVEDHPFDYGGFEGIIPGGNYGAGEVIVWDNGTYTPDEHGELSWGDKPEGSRRMLEGIADGKLSFTLRGRKLRGSWTLVRIGGKRNSEGKDWLLIKHRDEYASTRDVLEEDRSVISGLSIRDLQEGRMPRAGASGGAPHGEAREAPFPDAKALRPMLPTLVAEPFSRKGWIFEPKMDGVRTLAFLRDGKVELRSRRGNAVTVQYPESADAVARQHAKTAVFDGEICALDADGAPDFQALQGRINLSRPAEVARAAAETPVIYYVFDLLYRNGHDLARVPLAERKALLRQALDQDDSIRYVEHIEDDGEQMYDAALGLGFEGFVAKRATSTYDAGARSQAWLKAKATREQEFVVGGFTEGEGGRRSTFGGILAGYYEGDDLRFAASVGSGFTDRELERVYKQLQPLRTERAPFVNPPTVIGGRWSGGKSACCFWVRPELVARVKFSSWTREGNLRAPVFVSMRDDIAPRAVTREENARQAIDVIAADDPAPATSAVDAIVASVVAQLDRTAKGEFPLDVGGVRIKLTNLDKVFWPATKDHPARTKRDLMRYYAQVAPALVPHLRDRPLTLNRFPNGIDGKNFYQKHWPQAFPKEFRVERAMIYSGHNDADGEYILVNNIETLIWLAQLADIEMHAWMARVHPEPDAHGLGLNFAGSEENIDASVLNYPDFMVFDLDPYIYSGEEKKGEEPALNRRAFEKTREIAFSLKELLQQLRLSSFVKTTGKTGLHIYVPVVRQYTYDQIRAATETVGRFLVQQHPKDLTMEWAVPKRTGKVFFDHNQNARGKTLASEYSARPSPQAAVSAPVTWDELARVYPTDFDIDNMPTRLRDRGDVWADILQPKQDLRALLDAGGVA